MAMKELDIQIVIDSELYTKNPESTALGRNIVSKSIEMINELGFEAFTFKKLGQRLGSNESSIYRYFKNKHMLLVYLMCWYWSWIEYRILFLTANINNPEEKLKRTLELLTQETVLDNSFSYINEVLLHKIIIAEASKTYHTKNVDKENEKGYYKAYKRVVKRVANFVLEIQPNYNYPHMLISTVIEGAHQQRYFSEHLPSLTDKLEHKDAIVAFYTELVLKAINKDQKNKNTSNG